MSEESSLIINSIHYFSNNKEWLFSGAGIVLLSGVAKVVINRNKKQNETPTFSNTINLINTNSIEPNASSSASKPSTELVKDEDFYKNTTKILIVDDEIKFKLPKIFKSAGWVHSKLIKDIDNLDHPDVKEADILFIDVQGVGVSLGFKDEGLGLVEALKEKYPSKKVIIYSVVSQGDRFHNAFNVCDGQLSKDADPYQFQRVLEKFAFSELNHE
ncbi:putative two-component system response regulatory protein [Shewanella baltica]|uniref:putative two-component system response regulatory protein n=1 Tax=Shewanella baltica TaxID=62322 RepID=UPI0002112E55|nr:putative two-component system response regulatory protein [Shewanella baltica]AEH16270.1 putative two-component system response regulatory protein [Shewanella baltica OS117]